MKITKPCSTCVFLLLASCNSSFLDPISAPQSIGSIESGYTYVPIDPFPVVDRHDESCDALFFNEDLEFQNISEVPYRPLLESLPDNAVRMSIEQYDTSGSLSFGAGGIGLHNERYKVTLDYINSDTLTIPVIIRKSAVRVFNDSKERENVQLLSALPEDFDGESVEYEVRIFNPYVESQEVPTGFTPFGLPVYVGLGLRITATVQVIGGEANISGLGEIGAEAESENLTGSLVVQTLGVNGRSVSAALPIQSELNRTTVQNAVVAIGSIKALLYNDDTTKDPRVVGVHLPVPGGKALVNAIISGLSDPENPVTWLRPCPTLDEYLVSETESES